MCGVCLRPSIDKTAQDARYNAVAVCDDGGAMPVVSDSEISSVGFWSREHADIDVAGSWRRWAIVRRSAVSGR